MRDDPLVSRAAPFTRTLSERFDVWPVNKQVSERERRMHSRITAALERPQRKAAVHQRVNIPCFESAEERGKAVRLAKRLATEHRHTVAGFANRVQQRFNENVHWQRDASI
jgi:hypothetical protein